MKRRGRRANIARRMAGSSTRTNGSDRIAAARAARRRDRLRESLWLVPLLGIAAGFALALALVAIDRSSGCSLVPQAVTGRATAVQQILTTSASSLLSLTSVVLSLTLVAVQLAMGQFSPRIVGSLLADRRSQASIALFLGTFVYSMVVLRAVNDQANRVPGLAVVTGYALIAASIAVLVLFVHHAGQSIRVSGLIDLVGDNTRAEIERMYPAQRRAAGAPDDDVILARDAGSVVKVERAAIVALAREHAAVLELAAAVGDFVPTGGVLFRVREGRLDAGVRAALSELVALGPERTHLGDPAYGFRKLVDIAERSIASSPFDDPTTSVQAIDRIHDGLRLLATREFPDGRHADADGTVRLVEPVMDWAGYVRLAFDEIRLVGAASPQVARRVRAALDDLRAVAPPDRRGPLEDQLALLDGAVAREFEDEPDRDDAGTGDRAGIGAGLDILARRGGDGAFDPAKD